MRGVERRPRYRVGVDMTSSAVVATSIATFGQRYLDRLFSPSELVTNRGKNSDSLAARFAAKEAVIKALAPEHEGIDPRDIEILEAPGGAPHVRLRGTARALARARRVRAIALSLSHEAGIAAAVAVAYCSWWRTPRRSAS